MTVTDVYVWDETYDPRDVILRTSAPAATTPNPSGGSRTSPWLSFPTTPEPPEPGAGHLHVDIAGEGRLRSGHVLTLDGVGRIIDPHETELLALVLLDLPEILE